MPDDLRPGLVDDRLPPAWVRARIRVEANTLALIFASPTLTRALGRSRSEPVGGRLLDPQVAAMLRLDDLTGSSDLRKLSPAQARRRLYETVLVVNDPGPADVATEDRELGTARVRVYHPPDAKLPAPGVVFIHGGGWVTCSVATHDSVCRHLAARVGAVVVSVRYRLAPEARFPAAVEDCVAAFRAVWEHADELGIDRSRLAVCGDSAGGNLSAVIAQKTAGEDAHPSLQVLLYPGLDARCGHPSFELFGTRYFLTAPMVDWYYDHYAGSADRTDPDLSPLLRQDVSRVCPALIYTCGFDPLVDEGAAYAEKLLRAGVRTAYRCFDTLPHGFALMNAVGAARSAFEEVTTDLRAALSAS